MIKYPFIPKGRKIKYVGMENQFMRVAQNYGLSDSLDYNMPTASVVVKGNKILGLGANGSTYHDEHGCERVRLKIPTGQHYELCEGCHPKNHSEPRAIKDAKSKKNSLKDADLYLWGHWWCCEPCWNEIKKAGIKNVYLLKDSEKLFNKESSENIVGHQFKEVLSKRIPK